MKLKTQLLMLKKQLLKIRKFRPPLYTKKEMKLSFEFGLVLSETAKDLNIKIKQEIVLEAEKIFLRELKINGLHKVAINFTPLMIAILESAR